MKIDYINGPKTVKIFGMSKYQMEINKRLDVELNLIEYDSIMQNLEKRFTPSSQSSKSYLDNNPTKSTHDSKIKNFIVEMGRNTLKNIDRNRYKLLVKNSIKKNSIKHITSQEFAYLLNSIIMKRNVITCYDLIPWSFEKNRSKLWKDNMAGLKKAEQIITISEFSKLEIIKYLKYPEDRIKVIYPGVDNFRYHNQEHTNIIKKLNLPEGLKFILYVGSETPRQNLPLLLNAFAKLKKKMKGVKLLKIGDPQGYGARGKLLKLINNLGLQNDVIFLGYVSESELPEWYKSVDILIYPCLYAGFGLPPLESMACGTPVITSNTSSLPEVVSDAGIMVDPHDFDSLALKMYEVLTNNSLRNELVKKGIKQAKLFTWEKAAKETNKVYEFFNEY
jgi:glycosyltransferase involved in cell wall biosynthesis